MTISIERPGVVPAMGDRIFVTADEPEAAAAWARPLVAEGLEMHTGFDPEKRVPVAGRAAVVLHLTRALAPQLPRLRALLAQVQPWPLLVAAGELTALDHILALEMGADDIFDSRLPAAVLAARLRAALRRDAGGRHAAGDAAALGGTTAAKAPSELQFGALRLLQPVRQVWLEERRVALSEGEFEVLWLLASHPGRALARADLQRLVHAGATPAGRGIDNRIYRIRAKLGDADRAVPRIRTLRHFGYVFCAEGW